MPSLACAKRNPAKRKPSSAKRKRQAVPKGLHFRARGPHKCVVNAEGKSLRGMHSSILKVIAPEWLERGYEEHEKARTLKEYSLPKPTLFIPLPADLKNTRKLAYSAKQGHRLDAQMGSVVQWFTGQHKKEKNQIRAPLRVFRDKKFRDGWIKLALTSKTMTTRLRTLCNTLMPETEQVVRWLESRGLEPIETQAVVAKGKVGTLIDLVVYDRAANTYISCELKNGCDTAYSNGLSMHSPFLGRKFTTHAEYELQSMLNSRLLKHTHPSRQVGTPLLVRPDRTGLSIYEPPEWAKQGEAELAARMGC